MIALDFGRDRIRLTGRLVPPPKHQEFTRSGEWWADGHAEFILG
jgi:hypothetical protein